MGQSQTKSITDYNYDDLNDLITKSSDYVKNHWQNQSDPDGNATWYWIGDQNQYKVGIHKDEWPLLVSRDYMNQGEHYVQFKDDQATHYYNADEDRWTESDSDGPSKFLDELNDKWNNLIQSVKESVDQDVVTKADQLKEAHETAKDELIAKKQQQVGGAESDSETNTNSDNVETQVVDNGRLGKEIQKEYTLTLKAGETYEVTDLCDYITNIDPGTMLISFSDCNEQRETQSVASLELTSNMNQLLKTLEMFWLGGIANPITGAGDLPSISIIYGNDKKYNQVSMYYETKYALNISHISNANLEQIKSFLTEKEMPY